MVIPLAAGFAVGLPVAGTIAAFGAINIGILIMTSGQRTPVTAMLATSLGMALVAFAGSLLAAPLALHLLLLALVGFLAGLLVAAGPDAAQVGVFLAIALIVFGRVPTGPGPAAVHAAWFLLGCLLATAIAVLAGVRRPLRSERAAIAGAYRALAGATGGQPPLSVAQAAAAASAAIGPWHRVTGHPETAPLRGLVDEATRIRSELQGLSFQRPALGPEAGRLVDAARTEIAAALGRLAAAVERPRGSVGLEPCCDRIGRLARELDGEPGAAAPERFCADRLTALTGQLRAAARMADTLAGIRRASLPVTAGHTADAVLHAPGDLITLTRRVRAAAAPASPAFRHAVRLAIVLPLTAEIAALLPWPHGYWLSLTAVIVLKPDFGATLGLGAARILGTLAGVIATGLILALAHPQGALLVALVAVCTWAGFTLYQANYALYAIFLTALVLLLIAPAERQAVGTVGARALLTVLGGGIAVGAYLAWPTWQAIPLRSAAADRFEALASFLDAALRGYLDPAGCDGATLARLATAARRAQFRVQASLGRAAAEPAGVRPDIDDYGGVLAAGRRIAAGAHALASNLRDPGAQIAVPEAAVITGQVESAMTAIVRAIRTTSPPGPLPGLRRSQQDLAAVAAAGQTPRHQRTAILAALLDPLVDAINTAAGQLADLAAADTRSGRPPARR